VIIKLIGGHIMSQKRKTAGKTAKKETPFFTLKQEMTQEEIVEMLSNAAIETIKKLAILENITVEEFLQNEELSVKFVKSIFATSEMMNISIEILEEALNKAFQSFGKTAKIKLIPIELVA
jgi:ribosome-interacting GTPase 1